MTTQTNRQCNAKTAIRLVGLFVAVAWGLFVIVGPLAMATMVLIPAGKIGLAIGNIALAAIMSAPWCAFGLPVVRRFILDL